MTVTDHILRMVVRPAERPDVERAVAVRWEISPSAVRRAPMPAIAAMNGQAEKISRATLVWMIEGELARAELRLEIGEDDVVIPLVTNAMAVVTHDGEWRHVEVADRLVVSERCGAAVYARTALLTGLLGLPGGVYDAPVFA